MSHAVITVLGHVDHGKTSLVKALTGTDTDTQPEEKRRRLTLSLGFARCDLPSGRLNLIDAPGHVDFLQTTIAGLSGVQAILLVVSAIDGLQEQTKQHIEIAHFMGLKHAVVAITKADRAQPDQCQTLRQETSGLLRSYGFESPSVCACSALSGDGLDTLKAALDHLVFNLKPPERPIDPYLPIDRVFSQRGVGTIITGTLLGGALSPSRACQVEPGAIPVSLRRLQVNGEEVAQVAPGARVAVNLRNSASGALSRGSVLCAVGAFAPSKRFDIRIKPGPEAPAPMQHMEHVVALHGTQHSSARVKLYDLHPSDPTLPQYAQLLFQKRQIAYAGQPVILLRQGHTGRLAGGQILDPVARDQGRRKARQIAVLEATHSGDVSGIAKALTERDGGYARLDDVVRLAGLDGPACRQALMPTFVLDDAGNVFDGSSLDLARTSYLQQLDALHAIWPLRPAHALTMIRSRIQDTPAALLTHAEASLIASGDIERRGDGLARSDHDPFRLMSPGDQENLTRTEAHLLDAALQPGQYEPSRRIADEDLIDLLVWSGRALRLYNHALRQSLVVHCQTARDAATDLANKFPAPTQFTTSEARHALGTNRKLVVPLLEYFDRKGLTTRQGNARYFNIETQG